MFRFDNVLLAFVLLLSLAACSTPKGEKSYPEDADTLSTKKYGSILDPDGDGSGFTLFDSGNRKKDGGASGIGVNGYLWRAALDTISFMPIASADPFGGVIITDWYTNPNAPDERLKLTVLILDRELRADGVRVNIFRQNRVAGSWDDAAVAPGTGTRLEDTILTRARELRVNSETSR